MLPSKRRNRKVVTWAVLAKILAATLVFWLAKNHPESLAVARSFI